MAVYRRSINLIPQKSEEEIKKEESRSTLGVYTALLPMFAALTWLILVYVNSVHQSEIDSLDQDITDRQQTIDSYATVRQEHTELVKKVEVITNVVQKDFEPNQFFRDLEDSIESTQDAQSGITSYERDGSGMFTINAKAGSYLDLAKIIVVFENHTVFANAVVDKISLDETDNTVNFELTFEYLDPIAATDNI